MLGHPSAREATTGASYSPPGPGTFLANSFMCRGDESHIPDCPFLSAELCAPEERAGVVCQGNRAGDTQASILTEALFRART